MRPELIASIPALAKTSAWQVAKRDGYVVLNLERQITIELVEQPTKIGKLRFYQCPMPGCSRRCRDLFTRDGRTVGCKVCMDVRHPDSMLSTRFGRKVVLPARQIARIDQRLQQRGFDRNYRRRLRRRRKNLMTKVESELAQRQLDLRAALELAV